MKRRLDNCLKTRISQTVLLLALVALVAAFAKAKSDRGPFKIGGTWGGQTEGGLSWVITYSPDPSGRNATFTEEWVTNGGFDYIALAPVGADKVSIASGSMHMTGRDSAVAETIWYLTGPAADASLGLTEIKAIAVLTGDIRFIDQDTMEGVYALRIYDTLDPDTGERIRSMVPTEAMGDPYLDMDEVVAVSKRIL
jgi:hypothetical protein